MNLELLLVINHLRLVEVFALIASSLLELLQKSVVRQAFQ